MSPQQPQDNLGCMTLIVALCVVEFLFLTCCGSVGGGVGLAVVTFFALAVPVSIVKALTAPRKRTNSASRNSAKAPVAPKPPTKAEILRQARVELEEALAVIAGLAMDEDEKDVLRERAREAYLDKVSPFLT